MHINGAQLGQLDNFFGKQMTVSDNNQQIRLNLLDRLDKFSSIEL